MACRDQRLRRTCAGPRKAARPNRSATRSSRNVAGVNRRARLWRTRSKRRSKILEPDDIALSYRVTRDRAMSAGDRATVAAWTRLFRQVRLVRHRLPAFVRVYDRRCGSRSTSPCRRLCPSCREPLGDGNGLCAHCWSRLSLIEPPYCARLGIPFTYDPGPGLLSMEAIANPPSYDRARAAVRYDDISRALVHSLKYGDRLDLAPMMGQWMARAGRELLSDADALVPVPATLAATMGAALQSVGGSRRRHLGIERRARCSWRAQTCAGDAATGGQVKDGARR